MPQVHSDPQESRWRILNLITELLRSEMQGPSTRRSGFGYAYEVLRLQGPRFEYFDDILYVTMKCVLDENGRYVEHNFASQFYKLKAEGNCTIVNILDRIAGHGNINLITPPGHFEENISEDLAVRVRNGTYSYPFNSQFYSMIVEFQAPGFVCPPIVFMITPDVTIEKSGFSIDASVPGTINIDVSKQALELWYKLISDDQRILSSHGG
jgi:hypothetical protein